jgi:hypothetical protein
MAFDATLLVQLAANYSPVSAFDFQAPTGGMPYGAQYSFTNGAGANQSDRIWADQRTLNASTNDDLDLAGVLTDVFGASLTFARIKGMIVRSNPANTQTFSVGGGTNPFVSWATGTTPAVVVRPGGLFMLVAPDATGYAVAAGTADILRIANGAGSPVTYDIVLWGSSS